MFRTVAKLVVMSALVVAGSVGLFLYQTHNSAAGKLRDSERRNEYLKQIVQRLHAEKRVADLVVIGQEVADGRPRTTLLLVEYARDGSPLPGKRFTIDGNVAHIDAMVVKFDGEFVEQNDPLRGHSIALFTRLYGEKQAPEHGFVIDPPNEIPDVYRGADPQVSHFEQELWKNFWKLADDESYRKSMGVRVAQGEGVWGPFHPDRLYTLTLDSDGGLNLISTPLKGIYREALKRSDPAKHVPQAL